MVTTAQTVKRTVVTVRMMTSVITSLANVQAAARMAGQATCASSRVIGLSLIQATLLSYNRKAFPTGKEKKSVDTSSSSC